jgi:geranylgeranyl diphosphate synthase type II
LPDFTRTIARLKDRVDEELLIAAPQVEPRSLYEPVRYFLSIGGKRLRPILLLLSARTVGGDPEAAMHAAVAIELLHNFTLVHDDIMDHDHLRRGHATVHTKWDESVAILAGDGLIGLAYRQLLRVPPRHVNPVFQLFTEGVIEVCEGQAFDKEFEVRDDVTLPEYFRMIGKKTGRLITMATQIGAILGGGSDEEVEILRRYGHIIGVAFQVQDDLLDIIESEEVIGKTFGSDVSAGKKTYLMIKSLELPDEEQRRRVRAIQQTPQVTPELLVEMQSIFRDSGIFDQAQAEIQDSYRRANEVLDRFPRPEATRELRDFTGMLLTRRY